MLNELVFQTYKYIPYQMFSESFSCVDSCFRLQLVPIVALFFLFACGVLCVLFVAYLCLCNSSCEKFSFSKSFSSLTLLLFRIKKKI